LYDCAVCLSLEFIAKARTCSSRTAIDHRYTLHPSAQNAEAPNSDFMRLLRHFDDIRKQVCQPLGYQPGHIFPGPLQHFRPKADL
jgi:hypothetical protein